MSGIPGTGKSTLAARLGERLGLVVLDTDVVKSALLRTGVPLEQAGPATYAATLDVAAHLLAQGSSVVLDSPCRYLELLDTGVQIAADASVPYRLIELWVDDVAAVLPRLDARTPRPSQVASASQPPEGTVWESGTPLATLSTWQGQLVRPPEGWVRLDATRPVEENLARATEFLSPSPGSTAAT